MIWPKEISFDGLDKKVSGWCRAHFLGDPPIDAQFALDLIFKTLVDDKEHLEYLTTMPESTEQVNSLKLDAILWKYSRAYRKWIRKGLKDIKRRKKMKKYINKCDCYRVESEQHHFIDENGVPVYEDINVARCWGTREKDVCSCDGDKSMCNFYESVRAEAAKENNLSKDVLEVLEEIEDLIMWHWGCNPIYYTDSEDKAEASAAKLCCKILEVIHVSRIIEANEKDS